MQVFHVTNLFKQLRKTMDIINIAQKFNQFTDHWTPKVIGALNGQQVKIAKIKGDFIWHDHEHEDELFLVIKGTLGIEFRDKTVELQPGEMIIVPRGVEHRPFAREETEIMMFEPSSTVNTGAKEHKYTHKNLERL